MSDLERLLSKQNKAKQFLEEWNKPPEVHLFNKPFWQITDEEIPPNSVDCIIVDLSKISLEDLKAWKSRKVV